MNANQRDSLPHPRVRVSQQDYDFLQSFGTGALQDVTEILLARLVAAGKSADLRGWNPEDRERLWALARSISIG